MPTIFEPGPTQTRFLQSQARFIGFVGGIGSGKTAVGAVKAVTKINTGEDGIIVGPDFPHFAKSTWPQIKKWFPWSRCTNAHLDHPYTQKKVLEFDVRGKLVTVYYGGIEDEDSWTGPTVNWFFFDEGRRKRTREAFDTLAGRIRTGENPQGWVTSSPNGINHWMYEVFVKGIFPDEVLQALREAGYVGPIVEYFPACTEENRAHLDPFYYLSLTGLYAGKLAEQELGGQFVSTAGKVWTGLSIPTADGPEGEIPEGGNVARAADYHHGVPVEWWIDDGFTKGHPRVILFAQVVPPHVHIFDEYVATYEQAEVSIAAARAKGYADPSVVYIDSSAAELRQRLFDADFDVVKATHDVAEGVKHVAPFILNGRGERCLLIHPRCSYTLRELPAYEYEESDALQPLKPRKEDDHCSDAVRYGLWTRQLAEITGEASDALPVAAPDAARPHAPVPPADVPAVGAADWYREHWGQLLQQGKSPY